jgi:hypothetical protein
VQLTNDSGFPAKLARAQLLYRDLVLATVVVKASFDVSGDGAAATVAPVAPEAQVPVSEADTETPLGNIDGDVVPIKAGCDVAVLGHARSPRADRPVPRQLVELRIGRFSRVVVVFGDRTWVDGGVRAPRPTEPVPFTALPLTYDRAFGGVAHLARELEAPYPQNPGGRGHVRLRPRLAGTPLPNIEEIDQQLSSWQQQPMTAGLAPLPRTSSLRLEGDGYGADLRSQLVQLGPAAFSFAHPRMRLDRYPAGVALTLAGATHDRPWRFTLPAPAFTAVVTLGDARHELPLVVDTLCLFPDHRRLFVVARRAFIYQFVRERPRAIAVVAGPPREAPAPTPAMSAAAAAAAEVVAKLARTTGTTTGTTRTLIMPPTVTTTTIAEQRAAAAPVVPIVPAAAPGALPLPFDDLLPLYPLTRIVEGLPLCPAG